MLIIDRYYCPDDGVVRFVGVDMDEAGDGLIALDRYELRLSYSGKFLLLLSPLVCVASELSRNVGQWLGGVTRGNDEDDLNWLNPFEGQLYAT